MGDPKKTRKKYKTPIHPWQRGRIEEERIIKKAYGLKNKTEIWKASSELMRINGQVKNIIREKARGNKQALKEEKQLLEKLNRYRLINANTKIEEVLGLNINNILDRRLQSVVFRSGLAINSRQARQLIVHGHIFVDGRRVSVPSYFVNSEEELKISFDPSSSFFSGEHPERIKKSERLKAAERALAEEKKAREKEESETLFSEEEIEKLDAEVGGEVSV